MSGYSKRKRRGRGRGRGRGSCTSSSRSSSSSSAPLNCSNGVFVDPITGEESCLIAT